MKNVTGVLGVNTTEIERQLTRSDCAIWAIKAMCFQLEVSVPPANLIRKYADLENGGTTVRGVRDALQQFGISAQPVTGPTDAVARAPLPAIAMIRVGHAMLHYVVVLSANHRSVRYLDPAVGGSATTVSAEQFAAMFTGCIILCERKPDYIARDLGKEPAPSRFFWGALCSEFNAVFALALGGVVQLTMLLLGILMLKNFLSSSSLGAPNFWFLGGIAVCAAIYIWFGRLVQAIKADVKSRAQLSLFGYATELIRTSGMTPRQGLRSSSSRCVNAITKVAGSLDSVASIPGSTICLILFVGLILCFDVYAAWYAVAVAVILPLLGLWRNRKSRMASREFARVKDENEVGLVCLMAIGEGDSDGIVDELPWQQLALCDSLARRDRATSFDILIVSFVSRLNVFAGLLIGGLQHSTMGIGHTITVFFLLSIFSSVVGSWAREISSLPEHRFQVRALLDFLSDFTSDSLGFPKSQETAGIPSVSPVESQTTSASVKVGGVL